MQKILHPVGDFDKDIWYKSPDPDFIDISFKSRASERWMAYNVVLSSKWKDSVIKPLNWYAANIIAPPKLVSIINNTVTLRQYTHADIYLLQKRYPDPEEFYHVDRPWIRQYYLSNELHEVPDNCFPGVFKFYTPWFVDDSFEVEYKNPSDGSAFHIYEKRDFWYKPAHEHRYVSPHMIPFSFKKIGDHMEDEDFGVIKMPEPMYDMVFQASDIIVERIKEFYEHN